MIELPLIVDLEVESDAEYEMEIDTQIGSNVEEYEGSYTVTPSDSQITLETANKLLTQNVTVEAVPSTKNVQVYNGKDYVTYNTSASRPTRLALVCKKTGIYNVSWVQWRQSTGGTDLPHSSLSVNGMFQGSTHIAPSTVIGDYCQEPNISIAEGQTVVIRAIGTRYGLNLANLIIEEV